MTQIVRDTRAMLAGMTPVLREGRFVFCATDDVQLAARARDSALMWFREDEGLAMVLEAGNAASLGFDCGLAMRRIVLEVFSALDGVGLTAAVASALAREGIPCNAVSAYHHDNVFVPERLADNALLVLQRLQVQARSGEA